MKLSDQGIILHINDNPAMIEQKASQARNHSRVFSDENNIERIEQQNIISSYFDIFDEVYSEVTIKNLLKEKLQPAHILPRLHNSELLSSKADELLNFSLSI